MNQQRPEYLGPALIGGVLAGFLSGIPYLNCLCCLWIIGGAILAAHTLVKRTDVTLTAGDGAIVGALTGIVAAVVDALMDIPLRAYNLEFARRLMDRLADLIDEMPAGWESMFDRGPEGLSAGMFLLGLFLSAVVFSVLGVLGGIIGISLFGRKSAPPSASAPSPRGPVDAV